MRWCLFLLLAALLPAQSTPESGGTAATVPTARLEGQVLSQAGEATVRLEPYGGSRQNAVAYTDTSDTNGNFVFETVTPGRYTSRYVLPSCCSVWRDQTDPHRRSRKKMAHLSCSAWSRSNT